MRKLDQIARDKGESLEARKTAAMFMLDASKVAIESLTHLVVSEIELVRPFAEAEHVWPSFVSPSGDLVKQNALMVKALDVGKRAPIRLAPITNGRGKRFSIKTPANQAARELWNELIWFQTHCRCDEKANCDLKDETLKAKIMALPRYSSDCWKDWSDCAWRLLIEQTNGTPEKISSLRAIGLYRENHSKNSGSQKAVTSATRESNIRDGLRQRVMKAFKSLAPLVP